MTTNRPSSGSARPTAPRQSPTIAHFGPAPGFDQPNLGIALRIVLLLGIAVTSLGCASAGSRSDPAVDAPIPSQWRKPSAVEAASDSASVGTVTTSDDARDWWRLFEDSELERLVEIALESNRDLRSAAARLDAALAQARIAGASLEPEASLSTQGSRTRQNFIGLPIPGTEGRVLSNTSTALGASLNVSWEADLWGRIRDGQRAAMTRADAAAGDLAAARLSITGQTAKAWFAYLEAAKQVALAKETLDNRASVRRRIERRYRQGLRTALDLRLASADEAGAEARHAARLRQRDTVRHQLEVLLARNAEALDLIDSAPSAMPSMPPPPDPGIPGDILRRRPDLMASESRLAAAGLDVGAARKLLYPRLTLTGSAGTRSQEPEDLLDGDFSVWSLAAGLLQPLFQGGRLRAGVALSEAGQRDVLAQHENAVIRALSEVEAQLANDVYLSDQQVAVAKANRASIAAEKLARDRYFSGLSDYLSLLAAQDRATSSASQLLEIDRLRLERRVDLYLALGGAALGSVGAAETHAAAAAVGIAGSSISDASIAKAHDTEDSQ